MLAHSASITSCAQQPFASSVGVGHGLLCGERLGSHEKQCGLRVEELQCFSHVGAVNVRYEVYTGSKAQSGGDMQEIQCLAYRSFDGSAYGVSAWVTMTGPRSEPVGGCEWR